MTFNSNVRSRVLLATVSTCFALLMAECVCRVVVHLDNEGTFQVAMAKEGNQSGGGRVALIDIIRSSANPKIVFELRPGLDKVPFKNQPVSTNQYGFRGAAIDEVDPADTVTILGLGDSIMFGWGVGDGQEYMAILERRLRQMYPNKKLRVINTAVPAYNTVMEVETLVTKGLQFKPDLVILGIVPNDLGLPEYLRVAQDVFDPKRSFLAELVAAQVGGSPADGEAASPEDGRDKALRHVTDEDHKTAELGPYKEIAGWAPFLRALRQLKELSEKHQFKVVSVSTVEDETAVRLIQSSIDMGFEHVRVLPEIQKYMAENHGGAQFSAAKPEPYLKSKLAVSLSDGHPSPLQHSMVAQKLIESLERSGTLERLMK